MACADVARANVKATAIILTIVSLPLNAVPLSPAKQERPEAGMNRKVPFPPEKLGRVEGVDEAGGDRCTAVAVGSDSASSALVRHVGPEEVDANSGEPWSEMALKTSGTRSTAIGHWRETR